MNKKSIKRAKTLDQGQGRPEVPAAKGTVVVRHRGRGHGQGQQEGVAKVKVKAKKLGKKGTKTLKVRFNKTSELKKSKTVKPRSGALTAGSAQHGGSASSGPVAVTPTAGRCTREERLALRVELEARHVAVAHRGQQIAEAPTSIPSRLRARSG